jgi:hypothetical protein
MKANMILVLPGLLVVSGLIAACASRQGAPVAAAAVVAQSSENPDVVNQSYIKSGYRAVRRKGQLLYCRSEVITGSLLPSTVCLTDAQMKATERNTQDMADQLNKSRSVDCRVYKC